MDPQQRLLLEQAHLALADARPSTNSLLDSKTGGRLEGAPPRRVPRRGSLGAQLTYLPPPCPAGVYVGCMYQEYTQLQYSLGQRLSPAVVTGNGISYLVGRVSYTFGLQGACAGGSWELPGAPVSQGAAWVVRQAHHALRPTHPRPLPQAPASAPTPPAPPRWCPPTKPTGACWRGRRWRRWRRA